MAECRIILERHGQSMGNFEHRFLGHTDLPLSPLGFKQARCTAEFLKDEKIDVLYASDLKRAYQTGEALAELKKMPLIATAGMREIFAGEWEGLTFEEIALKYPDEFAVWHNDIGRARCNGGESVAEVYERIFEEICRIGERHLGQTVFIATHAVVIRVLKTRASGLTVEHAKDFFWVPNASVTEIAYSNGAIRLLKDTVSAHLEGLETALPPNV